MESKSVCSTCGKLWKKVNPKCIHHKRHRSIYNKEYSARPESQAIKKQYMLEYRAHPKHKERMRICNLRYKHKPENKARAKLTKELYFADPERRAKANKQRALNHYDKKMRVLRHYSHSDDPYCACCGETEISFLTLEHGNGDGAQHRKRLGKQGVGPGIYRWVIKEGFPDDLGLEVLCWNCQWGRYLNDGICPHKS